MVTLMVVAAGVMYALEREAQPEVFGSITKNPWWAIVTMGTVGYGDMVPITPAGKLFASLVMLIGIAMFAVPAGIMATGFSAEIRKRNFVVNWQMVARVPLFKGLDAVRIADIARLLKPEVVPEDYVIVRRGEPAQAMFFIVEGNVEIDVVSTPIRLGKGQYFGEIGLLRDTVRTATVTAISETGTREARYPVHAPSSSRMSPGAERRSPRGSSPGAGRGRGVPSASGDCRPRMRLMDRTMAGCFRSSS